MTPTLSEELRSIRTFHGLSDEALDWLASHMEVRTYKAGEILAREGEPAEYLTVLFEGEVRGMREAGGDDGRIYIVHAGQVSGMLPFSRLTHFPLTTRAAVPSRIGLLHRDNFPEMLRIVPELHQRLVNVMADRIRETTAADQQRDKLSALGKLSAGLAHELNNPAAAAGRAAQSLRAAVDSLRQANARLDEIGLTPAQRHHVAAIEEEVFGKGQIAAADALDRSDLEERISARLEQNGIDRPWELASGLVDAGADESCLDELEQQFQNEALPHILLRFTATAAVSRLLDEIENSTSRISDLVRAIKEYSYMDQMPEQEVDVHSGIESTLLILKHQWKHGVEIVREYDRTLPTICAKGSELNQVWTNLIDNAIDAMKGKGVLRIRTAREWNTLLVEIVDNGPGIPAEIQSRIFEPFFTTKPVGEGTGLGLDTVYRIVRNHHGDIRLTSRPGETCFQVRLPFANQTHPPV
jgi:signal transduction histidine kinase